MKLYKKSSIFAVVIFAIFITLQTSIGIGAQVNTMTKELLKDMMNDDTVSILDVRRGRDWSSSEFKIKGADRIDPQNFDIMKAKYPKDNTLVLYCA